MIAVIVAGGTGTRLWPLSTKPLPKHLLKIDNDERSLLYRTYERARQLTDDIYVVTEASQLKAVREHLPELPETAFIVEPARRGLTYCFLAALIKIAKHHDPKEPIAFMYADHHVPDVSHLVAAFIRASDVAESLQRIVIIGTKPTYPATGFGYIRKGAAVKDFDLVFAVSDFKEKPDLRTAEAYVESGDYLWGTGYYVGSIQAFTDAMRQYSPALYQDYTKLSRATPQEYIRLYLDFESSGIAYALLEKTNTMLVVSATFEWRDVGSFKDLHASVSKDEKDNHIIGDVVIENVHGSLLQNFEDKPVVVIGIDNIVVINTPDGVLVVPAEHSQKVGAISKHFL